MGASGLNCMKDLLLRCTTLHLWLTGSAVVTPEHQSAGYCSVACGILVPWPGIEPVSLHCKVESEPLAHQQSPQALDFIWVRTSIRPYLWPLSLTRDECVLSKWIANAFFQTQILKHSPGNALTVQKNSLQWPPLPLESCPELLTCS